MGIEKIGANPAASTPSNSAEKINQLTRRKEQLTQQLKQVQSSQKSSAAEQKAAEKKVKALKEEIQQIDEQIMAQKADNQTGEIEKSENSEQPKNTNKRRLFDEYDKTPRDEDNEGNTYRVENEDGKSMIVFYPKPGEKENQEE